MRRTPHFLKAKFLDRKNAISDSLMSFGIRLNKVGRDAFDQPVRVALANNPLSAELMEAMLSARAALWRWYCRLHDLVVKIVARASHARASWRSLGAGDVEHHQPAMTALSQRICRTLSTLPPPFARRRGLLRLTSRRWQSGSTIDVQGRSSKAGDADVRRALYEAASGLMTRFKGADKVKSWGQAIARRSCHRKACVAVARKLAMIMHALWSDGTFYVGDPAASQADAGRRVHDKARELLGARR